MATECKVFVKNIPYDCTEEEFRNVFSTYGEITDVKLIKRYDGHNNGCGFVTYATKESKNDLLSNNNVVMCGRHLVISNYENQRKGYNLNVSNVPENLTNEDIYHCFAKFGSVVAVMKDYENSDPKQKFNGSASVMINNYDDFNNILSMKVIKYSDDVTFTVTKRTRRQGKLFGLRFITNTPIKKPFILPPLNRPLNIQRPKQIIS